MATFALGELFTIFELALAANIAKQERDVTVRVNRLEKEVVEPAITRINKLTGQENLPRYFAYFLEFSLARPLD